MKFTLFVILLVTCMPRFALCQTVDNTYVNEAKKVKLFKLDGLTLKGSQIKKTDTGDIDLLNTHRQLLRFKMVSSKLVAFQSNIVFELSEYNKDGDLLKRSFFDAEGKPTGILPAVSNLSVSEYFILKKNAYLARKKLWVSGEPLTDDTDQKIILEKRYDPQGKFIGQIYYSTEAYFKEHDGLLGKEE